MPFVAVLSFVAISTHVYVHVECVMCMAVEEWEFAAGPCDVPVCVCVCV